MRFLSLLLKSFINFLFPRAPRVIELEKISTVELAHLLPEAPPSGDPNTIVLFEYSHSLVKEIIWEVKYGGNTILAAKLGELLHDTLLAEIAERGIVANPHQIALVPIPVSNKRRFERGWNQAELLAKAVKNCDSVQIFKYVPGQLVKIRHTESQTRTSGKTERKRNLTHSMTVLNPLSLKEKLVIVIDDVMTTGSTFAEARRALKESGVRKVLCIAVAH